MSASAIALQLFSKAGIPAVAEHKFHETRRWRFDYAWPRYRVALEVEGGVWTGGRHTRGKGFLGDVEKYNTAAAMGWRVLRCTPDTLLKFDTIKLIQATLAS
ncbi:hypothetical protein OpiT1DRAFT_03874 [Opitutaceae bacterium TAV1]|nr:hypothetical protein OpiT1DRAFT_03874 [Opitutaceae bacterium TAV1]